MPARWARPSGTRWSGAAGAGAAFYLNAACTLVLAGALLWWPHHVPSDDLPRERVGSASVGGLRYAAEASGLRAVYGLLLGGFGLGALAGAFAVHCLRRRYGAERVLTALAGIFGEALLVFGLVPSVLPAVTVALALAGAAWLGSFSTFNIAVQMTTAFWVQARVLALYQATIFGSMAAGSWLWGQVAHVTSLETGYLAAGSLLPLSIALHRRWRLPASEAPDLRPRQLPELKLAFPFDREAGPVMVLIEYRVPLAKAAAFVRAMEDVGLVRKRDGAWRWHLFQDTADAEHWHEAFTVASWLHYLRQRRRGTAADEIVLEGARRFLDPGFQPLVRRMIARGREMTMTSDDTS